MPAMKSVSSALLLTLFSFIAVVDAAPYQELAPRDGYVPVYIRIGDTPLYEIHPKLAEAFNEIESSNLMLEDDSNTPDIIAMPADKNGATDMVNDQLMEESKTAEAIEVIPNEANKKETDVPATEAEVSVTEVAVTTKEAAVKTAVESDIASFDVVKMDDAVADVEEPTNATETKAKEADAVA